MSKRYRILNSAPSVDGKDQLLAPQTVVLASDYDALCEQSRVLREALQEIYEGRWTPGVSCCYEDDARSIYPTREMRIRSIAQAALTATSQPHTQHDIAQAEANGFL